MARDSKFTEEEISILKEKAAEELQRSASASDPAEARGATALGGADHLHPGGRGVGRTWRTEALYAAAVSVQCRIRQEADEEIQRGEVLIVQAFLQAAQDDACPRGH